jgi:uncharacterized protein
MARTIALPMAIAIVVAGCDRGATPATGNSTLDVGRLRVQDQAELLTGAQEIGLVRRSEALENATTDQLVIVTVPTLNGKDIAHYSTSLANRLAIGQAGKDNGVLLVVAPNERKVRIAVGYGLEGLLTDRRSAEIVGHMLPHFRSGDHAGAIEVGVNEIDVALRSDTRRPQYLKKAM